MSNPHLLVEEASFSVQNADTFEVMLSKSVSELSAVLESHDADVAAIKADKTLSQIGQLEKVQERAARAADWLVEFDRKAAQIDTEAAKHVTAMTEALASDTWESPLGNVDTALRSAELRQILRGMDPLERQGIYREAVRTGDLELVQVFEQAHPLLKLVPADLVAEQRKVRASRLKPDAACMADDLGRLRRTIQGNVGMARQHLKKNLHPGYGDTLAATAAGKKGE